MKIKSILMAATVLLTVAARGAEAESKAMSFAEMRALNLKLTRAMADSLVEVEYFFAPDDKGERNEISFGYLCPNCRSMHYNTATSLIENQESMRIPGFALSESEFVFEDSGILPEFLDRAEISFKGKLYPAEIVMYYPQQNSVKLRTKQPVPGIRPLVFKPDAAGRKYQFFNAEDRGIKIARTVPFNEGAIMHDLTTGQDYLEILPNVLLTNAEAEVIALSLSPRLAIGENPYLPPAQWQGIAAADFVRQIRDFEQRLNDGLYAARILLESKPQNGRDFHRGMEEEQNEFEGIAVRLDKDQVLLNISLSNTNTARLKRITLWIDGKEVNASFVGSLRYFGGLVAKLEPNTPGKPVALYPQDLRHMAHAPVYLAMVKNIGRKLDIRVTQGQLEALQDGFRGEQVPELMENQMMFTRDGVLLGLQLGKRQYGEESSYESKRSVAAMQLNDALKDYDSANIPRDGKAEYAWLGVELQPLTQELAKAKGIMAFVSDKESGMLVTLIYPGSPAEKIGLKVGDVLLTLTPASIAIPIKLQSHRMDMYDHMRDFPWEHYDEVPAEYFDQIPQPWGSTQSGINKLLTQIGVGGKASLQVISDGKLRSCEFEVAAEPESFDNAKRFQAAALGISVCNMTYEVRNYFKLAADAPGVIVATVRAGGKAAVAGVKPYEIIVSVNGADVKNIDEFQAAVKDQKELKLSVRRMAVTRVVTINN